MQILYTWKDYNNLLMLPLFLNILGLNVCEQYSLESNLSKWLNQYISDSCGPSLNLNPPPRLGLILVLVPHALPEPRFLETDMKAKLF